MDPYSISGRVKADLHMHGPIGFQKYWLKDQGYGGKNILKLIADSCLDKGVGITAITSDEDDIPRGSIHDRFGYLRDKCALDLPKGYEIDFLGRNVMMVARGEEIAYILNAQNVRTNDAGRKIGYNVLGTNQISNHKSLDETVKRVYETGMLIGGPEHAFCDAHHGIGEEKMKELLPMISFVEGHDAQMRWSVSEGFPVLGKYRSEINDLAQKFAEEHNKPWISVSNAHRIEDAGISYIEFDVDKIDLRDGMNFWKSLKSVIESGDFTNHCGYQSFLGWGDWVSSYVWGTKLGLDKKSEREMIAERSWR